MPTEIKMPRLGESVVEGTISRWLKQPGERVEKYEALLEVTTDKVDTEVPAPEAGVLHEILVAEGETVLVGTPIALLDGQAELQRHQTAAPEIEQAGMATSADNERTALNSSHGFISPVVARLAAEHGLDLHGISGSGAGGRVTKKDLLRTIEESAASSQQPAASTRPPTLDLDAERVPLSPMRRAIAEHMTHSVRTAPHVTTFMEVDVGTVVLHRALNKAEFASQGVNLTWTAYFAQATVAGLQSVPIVNGSFTPEGIVQHRRIHLGIAVALDEGLIVPVIRDADEKSLLGLARAINDIAARARTRRLQPDQAQGGTFTLTNHGVGGSLFATPIINQPQSAILGIGAIQKRPVVITHGETDAIAIRPICYLSLTFDHRLIDGATADAFLMTVKHALEHYR